MSKPATRHTAAQPFSLPIYLLIVCLFSWPFQIIYIISGNRYRPVLLLSMIMVGVGTWVAGRLVFKDTFHQAGWRTGSWRYYGLAILLAFILWAAPVCIELLTGISTLPAEFRFEQLAQLLIFSMLLTALPAFGEEFSWRGYLLPKLLERYSIRQALLLHGLVTWFWHLPFLLSIGLDFESGLIAPIFGVLLVSIIPTTMHAVVFAWFWTRSGSLFVATFYHVMFDELRDSLQESIGLNWIAENWQMLALTVLGVFLLSRSTAYWRQARPRLIR